MSGSTNEAMAALEQKHAEHSVLEAAQASMDFTQSIEDALTLCRPWRDEPLTDRLEAVRLQAHTLDLLHGVGWHERPEAVALLT